MKFELEFKNFEVFKAQAEAKGFKVDLHLPDVVDKYKVKVTGPDGITKDAWVGLESDRHVLDTGRWYSKDQRLRIALGKKINIIGNKLKWMMAKKDEDWADRTQEYKLKTVHGELLYHNEGEWIDIEKEAT